MRPGITIAICTYNRAFYLQKCLEALAAQLTGTKEVQILVVDNNSTDNTAQVVANLAAQGVPISRVEEASQGLSYARNKAIKVCESEWLAYLDDDGIPHNNYVERMIEIIGKWDFDCFGGMYYAYYEGNKPKWISSKFGTKIKLMDYTGVLETGYLSGGIMVCKTSILKELGGFNTSLGMKGTTIGYGEEDDLQQRLRSAGYIIGFDPELGMDHLVAHYKLKPKWHIRRMYTMHRDTVDSKYKAYTLGYTLKQMVKVFLFDVPRLFKIFLKRPDYYRQNLYIDIGSKLARCWGLYKNRKARLTHG